MSRIHKRDGGVPDFFKLRDELVWKYGLCGANTEIVLEYACPKYRLHYKEVTETGAKQAMNA